VCVCGQIACCTHLLVYLSGAVVAAPPNLSARRSGQEWSNVILSRTAVVVCPRRKQGSSEVDPAISTASLLLNGGDKRVVEGVDFCPLQSRLCPTMTLKFSTDYSQRHIVKGVSDPLHLSSAITLTNMVFDSISVDEGGRLIRQASTGGGGDAPEHRHHVRASELNRFDLMVRMLCFVERGKPLLLPVDPLDLTPRCLIPGVEGRLRWRGI